MVVVIVKKLIPELKKLHDKIKEEKIDANIMKIDEDCNAKNRI